jgi:hypothetical protein
MNLLTLPFRLPFLPARGLVRLAEIIRDEADREYHDPAAARRQLEEAAQTAASGHMSEEEVRQREHEAVSRLAQPGQSSGGAAASGEEG